MPRKKTQLPFKVQQAIRGELSSPQLAEVSAHFFQIAGGTRSIARLLYNEYKKAKEGSLLRQRVLEMILRVAKFANEQQKPLADLALMSDEDLEKNASDLLLSFSPPQPTEPQTTTGAAASAIKEA